MNRITNRQFHSPHEVRDVLAEGPVRFINCNLSNLNLLAVSLDGCIFDENTKLVNVKLGSAVGCEFWSCDLTRLNLNNADIRNAKAMNCKANGMKFFGQQMTFNCYFLSGLSSSQEVDGWKLVYWAALADTPLRPKLLALLREMPEEYKVVIESLFEDAATGLLR